MSEVEWFAKIPIVCNAIDFNWPLEKRPGETLVHAKEKGLRSGP